MESLGSSPRSLESPSSSLDIQVCPTPQKPPQNPILMIPHLPFQPCAHVTSSPPGSLRLQTPWAPPTSKVSLVEDARLPGSLTNLLHTNTHTPRNTQTNTHRHTEMHTHAETHTEAEIYSQIHKLCHLGSTLSIAQGVPLPWCSETHVVPCTVALDGSLCN